MKLFERSKRKSGINLTALIDILFLLIVFFSVSTQFTNQKAIGIDLPKSKSSSRVATASKLIFIMRDEEEVFFNGKKLGWEQIEKELKSGNYDHNQKVILNIDKDVTHGKVVKLLDLLKLNQFKKIVFGTYGNS